MEGSGARRQCIYWINLTREMSKSIIVLGIMIVIASCGSDIDMFVPKAVHADTGDISRLMSRLRMDMAGDLTKRVSCPCYGDWAMTAGNDLVMVIPPDFADQSTYPCPEGGSYHMEVTICDTKGKLMVAGIPTVSDGRLLDSRAAFSIHAWDQEKPIELADGKSLRFMVNDPDPRDRMELFFGEFQNHNWLQADQDDSKWDNVLQSNWEVIYGNGQWVITGSGYESNSDQLGWIGIHSFYSVESTQRAGICIELPQVYHSTNTVAYMVFDNLNSVVKLTADPETGLFCDAYNLAPKGFQVTLIVLAETGNDEYYFAAKRTTLTEFHTEVIEPRKTPYEEILNFISSL